MTQRTLGISMTIRKNQLAACEDDSRRAVESLFLEWKDEPLLLDQFASVNFADHKKNYTSVSLGPGAGRSNYCYERRVQALKKEVAKKKALYSFKFSEELAEHAQEDSEDVVESNHADDILYCTVDMGTHYKTFTRKMLKMPFEEDFQAKEIDGKIGISSKTYREAKATSDFVETGRRRRF